MPPRRLPPPTERPSDAVDRPPLDRAGTPGRWLMLVIGLWLGRLSVVAPPAIGRLLDLAFVLAAAALVALWYRARARRWMAESRQSRPRRDADEVPPRP